jgi:hypothetical protein
MRSLKDVLERGKGRPIPRHAKSTSPAGVVGRGHRSAHADAQEMARRMSPGTVS